jgi:hypothetical protein
MYTGYEKYLLEPSYGAETEVLSVDHTHDQSSSAGAVVGALVGGWAFRNVARDFEANPDGGMAIGALSGAMLGWWVGGGVAHRFEGDSFGSLDVGNKKSTKRNQAFEILKKISAAIGHKRTFSASRFRGFTRGEAAKSRKEVQKALVDFAKSNDIKLKNPLDPLANKSTANANLEKVKSSSAAPPPAPTTTPPAPIPDPPQEPIPDTSSQWTGAGTTAAIGPTPAVTPGIAPGSLQAMAVRDPEPEPEKGWFASPMWGANGDTPGPSRTVVLSASAGILALGGVTWLLVSR